MYTNFICTPATFTAIVKTNHIDMPISLRLSFEKRGCCDDCKIPYNLLICFLSCGVSFVLCRMNNIRCITGCSQGGFE